MRITILKAKTPSLWYANKIGEEFDVEESSINLYALVDNSFYKLYKEDCTLFEAEIEED